MDNHSSAAWWKDPRGIVAVVTIGTLIIGIFYSREKLLWELTTNINGFEEHVDKVERLCQINENAMSAVHDRMADNEKRLEINAQRIIRMEGIIDRMYPQGTKE